MPETGGGRAAPHLREGTFPRRKRGKNGEDRAAAWLESRGFNIVARNFHTRTGEIDIIALDGECLVFTEVKAWSTYSADCLEQGIGIKKQRRIIETANYFLSINRKYNSMALRFDVIFIRQGKILWFPSAFMENL